MKTLDLPLTGRQRDVLEIITHYNDAIGEGCPIRYLARRLDLHRSTVHQHVVFLRRKGFLSTAGSPAFVLRRP